MASPSVERVFSLCTARIPAVLSAPCARRMSSSVGMALVSQPEEFVTD